MCDQANNDDLNDDGRGWDAFKRAAEIEDSAQHSSPLDMLTWDGRKSGEERQHALPNRMLNAPRVVVFVCTGNGAHAEEVIGQAAEVQPGTWELDASYGEVAQITESGRRRAGTETRSDLDEYTRRVEEAQRQGGIERALDDPSLLDGLESATDHRTATFLCPHCEDKPRAREGKRINGIMNKIVAALEPTSGPDKYSPTSVWEVGSWVLHERG